MKLLLKKTVAPAPAPAPPIARPQGKLLLRKPSTPAEQKSVDVKLTDVKKGNLDELAAFDIGASKNCLVPWYLMASYLYYIRDVSMLSDSYYDRVCHELLENFSTIKHMHKHLIIKNQLAAGTGFRLKFDQFPVRIFSAANHLAHEALGIPYPGK